MEYGRWGTIGGAEIVNDFLRRRLIDEFYISVIPVLLGAGIKLFQDDRPLQELKFENVLYFSSGLVQFHYKTMTKA